MKTVRIGFWSPQGGSGLTTLLVAVASRMQYYYRRKVAVVDCDVDKRSCLNMRLREDVTRAVCEPYPVVASDLKNCLKAAADIAGRYGIPEAVFFDLGRCRDVLLPMEMDLNYIPLVRNHMLGEGLARVRDMALLARRMKRRDGTECGALYKVFLNKCRESDRTLSADLLGTIDGRATERPLVLTERKVFWRKAFENNLHLGDVPVSTVKAPRQPFMKHSSLFSLESMILSDIRILRTETTRKL